MEHSKQSLLSKGMLLNDKGELNQAGYSYSLIKEYHRKDIKAWDMRIKEWDYYIITDGRKAIALTIADNSYFSVYSASFMDFGKKTYKTSSEMHFLTKGNTNLPESTLKGNVIVAGNNVNMAFINNNNLRHLTCTYRNFDEDKTLQVDLLLEECPRDSMVIATPFSDDPKAFYYNQKINCMTASGTVIYGEETFIFDKNDSLGTLDWGRGVWTYENTWYWGSLSGYEGKEKFGWNIGYGFGKTSNASENMFFLNGIGHKLNQVKFIIPTDEDGKEDYMSPWTFTSNDNRFEMDFTPIIDRSEYTNALILSSCQHQVFGMFNGKVILDNGESFNVKNKLGFAEKVTNKW